MVVQTIVDYTVVYLYYMKTGAFMKRNNNIKLTPEDPNPVVDKGNVYRYLKRYEESENEYYKALKITPKHFRAHRYLARLYLETERYQEALNPALVAVKSEKDYGFGHVQLGAAKVSLEIPGYCIDFKNAIRYNAKQGLEFFSYHCK
jgi:tetratricopeptide (TPR) repeat protein